MESKEFSHHRELQASIIDEDEMFKVVAERYNKSIQEICKMKNRPLVERKIAIYLLKQLTGLTNPQIGKKFGITFSAVSKATKDVQMLMEKDRAVRCDVEKMISSFKG